MKLNIFIDENREEEVVVYAHGISPLVEEIKRLIQSNGKELIGYDNGTVVPVMLPSVCCFTVENNKVYAQTCEGRVLVKSRLYQLEELAGEGFVKINQSCLANMGQIERFDASLGGTLLVRFKNGYTDYVSRRQLKTVKERLGL